MFTNHTLPENITLHVLLHELENPVFCFRSTSAGVEEFLVCGRSDDNQTFNREYDSLAAKFLSSGFSVNDRNREKSVEASIFFNPECTPPFMFINDKVSLFFIKPEDWVKTIERLHLAQVLMKEHISTVAPRYAVKLASTVFTVIDGSVKENVDRFIPFNV